MESPHKHHIIPKYHCEELGIDPDFDDNFVTIERIDHAQIHWEYYNGGYETLLKYIKPKPYVLINIPFGDKRDMWAAQVNGKREIDGVDMSGKNNPMYGKKRPEHSKRISGKNNPNWKGGIKVNDPVAYYKSRSQTPEYKEYMKERRARKKAERQAE